ncbi:uroporphyrinogen-III synthase [Curtobacterium sp. RRHDQ10]|uniref:uroporphyrinogen-III synthase n=1 Tax=Curtobacterium phyllosphaerae TaxID=3413379 RepID=UPI003BF1F72C
MVLPRGGEWAERIGREARARGLEPVTVPLITDVPPIDVDALARAVRALADGAHAWVVVTSATAVRVVADAAPRLQADGFRVAAVGEATAAACRAVGWDVAVVPEEASAADLVLAMPDVPGRVLFPRSDIAATTVSDGLRARGIDVEDVVAYRTVGTGTEPIVLDPAPDVVLVTSGSVAREVARRMTPLGPRTRIACIGPRTAADARAAGLPVHVVGRSRSATALLDAVVADLHTSPNHHTPER